MNAKPSIAAEEIANFLDFYLEIARHLRQEFSWEIRQRLR